MTTETPKEIPFKLDDLPEDLRGEPSLKDFKSVDALAKSYANAVKLVGLDKNLVFRIPKEGPDENVWKALGKPDKYEFPADLKTQLPDDYKAKLAETANKLNLTKTQWEEMLHFTDGDTQERMAASQAKEAQERADAEAALKKELGNAYDQTINLAKDALETLKKPELWDKLAEKGLTNDPDVIGALAEVGRLSKDETPVNGEARRTFALSPAQAQAEINALVANAEKRAALLDQSHPLHNDVVAERWRLMQIAHPENP